MKFAQLNDGSIIDRNGRILAFSPDRFAEFLSNETACFVCGETQGHETFTREHIVPKWLLKKLGLFSSRINLFGDDLRSLKYDRHTLPCCLECNSLMGRALEQPVQRIISGGFKEVSEHIKNKGPKLFVTWLALIFIKLHLKHKYLPKKLDRREGKGSLADHTEWRDFQHVHTLARAFYTGATILPSAVGTFILLQAKNIEGIVSFDFADLRDEQSMLLRIDDFCFVVVFNDSCGAFSAFLDSPIGKTALGEMSPIQLRELLAWMAFYNTRLIERPTFSTSVDKNGQFLIEARHPNEVSIHERSAEDFGFYMEKLCGEIFSKLVDENFEEKFEALRKGRLTFLTDDNGNFATDSMSPISPK